MARLDLQALATRVSDRESVDWDEIERAAPSIDERRVIRNLRLVESLASASSSVEVDLDVSDDFTASLSGSLTPRGDLRLASGLDAGARWGGLEIREKIGEGGFGEVYRAHDSNLEREVALKLIRRGETRAERVLKEGRALARVRHPNVVTVHGAEQYDGRVGLWMELVRGRSLSDVLHEQGAFGAREAALIGLDLGRALAAVHAAGLVHRDVKAQNVMREQGGRVVLMDFGTAFEQAGLASGSRATISGTPLYIAPELFAGAAAGVASDIYSLGVLLFHLVTESFPVRADSIPALRERHASGRADLLRDVRPDLPDEFVRVVQRAIDPEPSRRFATAGEMEQALARCLGLDAPSSAPGAASDGERIARRFPWQLLAIGALALTAMIVVTQIRRGEPAVADGAEARAIDLAPSEVPRESVAAPGRPPDAQDTGARPDRADPVTVTPARETRPSPAPSDPQAAAATIPVERPSRVPGEIIGEPYTIAASLYRRDTANRQDRIESGATLDADDRLWLELTVSREVWIYVINRDDKGNGYALFPLPTLDRQNPIPAGERVLIPGEIAGRPQYWGVSVSGGSEELLILASPERQIQFESEMAGLERPTPLAAAIDDLDGLPVRGLGAIVPGAVERRPDESAARLFDMAEVLVGTGVQSVNGVWFKKLTLNNPESW